MPKEVVSAVGYAEDGSIVTGEVRAPRVMFVGRMAQFLQRAQKSALMSTIEELVNMAKATGSGDWLMPLDVAKVARWQLTNSAVPQQCLRKQAEVDAMRQQAEAERQAAMQAQLAEQASHANCNQARANA